MYFVKFRMLKIVKSHFTLAKFRLLVFERNTRGRRPLPPAIGGRTHLSWASEALLTIFWAEKLVDIDVPVLGTEGVQLQIVPH